MHAYTRGRGVQFRTNEQAALQSLLVAGPLPTFFEWISFPPALQLVKRIGAFWPMRSALTWPGGAQLGKPQGAWGPSPGRAWTGAG
jgi:hypothetical protein